MTRTGEGSRIRRVQVVPVRALAQHLISRLAVWAALGPHAWSQAQSRTTLTLEDVDGVFAGQGPFLDSLRGLGRGCMYANSDVVMVLPRRVAVDTRTGAQHRGPRRGNLGDSFEGAAALAGQRPDSARGSDVVVELELVRVRAQLHGQDLVGALEVDPGLDQVGREDVAGRAGTRGRASRVSSTASSEVGTWSMSAISSGGSS